MLACLAVELIFQAGQFVRRKNCLTCPPRRMPDIREASGLRSLQRRFELENSVPGYFTRRTNRR